MNNPLIDQGQLNRLVASVVWPNYAVLNVTAPYLNKEAISLALEGNAAQLLETLTGAAISEEAYMPVTLTINLLKTQPLSGLYKSQMETDSNLGPCTVRPDSTILPPYDLSTMVISSVREQLYNGSQVGWVVTCRGIYYVNSALWQ